MMERDERELKQLFQAQRSQDSAHAPAFGTTLAAARARRPTTRRRLPLPAIAVAAAVVAVLVLVRALHDRRAGLEIDLASVHWDAPTDFLLTLPGAELLRTVPRLDGVNPERRIL